MYAYGWAFKGEHRWQAGLAVLGRAPLLMVSQCSLHNAPIFRLLLKVAVKGTHQCESLNFCGTSVPTNSHAALCVYVSLLLHASLPHGARPLDTLIHVCLHAHLTFTSCDFSSLRLHFTPAHSTPSPLPLPGTISFTSSHFAQPHPHLTSLHFTPLHFFQSQHSLCQGARVFTKCKKT